MRGRICFVLVSSVCGLLVSTTATVTTRKDEHNKDGKHNKDFDNDVIWGDEKTNDMSDDVDNLSLEEKQKRLTALVQNRIDKDRDGFVSMEELTDWAQRAYDLFELEETAEIFPDVDRNKDGAVQWLEYAEDSYGSGFSEDSDEFKNPQSVEWQEFVNTYKKEKKKCDYT